MLLKYSIGNHQPDLILASPDLSLGMRGQDSHLTEDGEYIFYITDSGNNYNYHVARMQVNYLSSRDYLPLWNFPRRNTASPEGKKACTHNRYPYMAVWDIKKQVKLCEYPTECSFSPERNGWNLNFTKLIVDKTVKNYWLPFITYLKYIRLDVPINLSNKQFFQVLS